MRHTTDSQHTLPVAPNLLNRQFKVERFFGSLKSEWLADQRYASRQAARRDVIEYIEMEYNSCRLHSTLDYQTPREIELAAAA